ncbi:hypothetical protein Cni_G09176 [Canna indica]|uniref:C2H2-type domain-containing protein n=1 Tax=Canna indica TaxID=4628 RepID=A0AAQ3Q934_9LILI|nr:hypothetical protein Cni_G09176 [Canna indica]
MLSSPSPIPPPPPPPPPSPFGGTNIKKRRRPAGTPDPDAEVVALSPGTLLESDRYVCEICNQAFRREQNLQMHLRRHKVPWKLLKRPESTVKRVFVCPEPSCLHHDPRHALGDLVGIKKHFRRKHSSHRQWICAKCGKDYAVQSDYKAHLRTCGTRGHSCDCGRVFSRVESFIEHQDTCRAGRTEATVLIPTPTSAAIFSHTMWSDALEMANRAVNFVGQHAPSLPTSAPTFAQDQPPSSPPSRQHSTYNTELQLLPPTTNSLPACSSAESPPTNDEFEITKLQLSLGPSVDHWQSADPQRAAARLKDETMEQLKLAMAEKELAGKVRREARRLHQLAEEELENAKRIRRHSQAELNQARLTRERTAKQIESFDSMITCNACKQQFQAKPAAMASEENSLVVSYMSEVTEAEEENCRH